MRRCACVYVSAVFWSAYYSTRSVQAPATRSDLRFTQRREIERHRQQARSVGGHTRTASPKCTSCERDANGRIKRNLLPAEFQKQHPCPTTGKTSGACAVQLVDRVVTLKHGGADEPSNMTWMTVADAKAKDRIE